MFRMKMSARAALLVAVVLSGIGCGTTIVPITEWDGNWQIAWEQDGVDGIFAVCVTIKDGHISEAEDGCNMPVILQTASPITRDEYGRYAIEFSYNAASANTGIGGTLFYNLTGVNQAGQLVGSLTYSGITENGGTFGPLTFNFKMRRN